MKSKGMQLGAVLAVMLIVSMAFVLAVSANKELNVTNLSVQQRLGVSSTEGGNLCDLIYFTLRLNRNILMPKERIL